MDDTLAHPAQGKLLPQEDGKSCRDIERKARDIVTRQLAMMDRSRQQLDEAMLKRDIPQEIRKNTLDYFEELGLVDDLHFARMLVRYRFELKGMSRRALAQELQLKGVSAENTQKALEEIDDEAEYQAAADFARKRLKRREGNPETLHRRVYAALARRGYSPQICIRAMKEAGTEVDEESSDSDLL